MNCWEHIDAMKEKHAQDVQDGKDAAKSTHHVGMKCHPHTGRWSARRACGWQGGADYLNVATVAELIAAMSKNATGFKRVPRERKPKPDTKKAA